MPERFVLFFVITIFGALVSFGQPLNALGENATCQPQPLEALELPDEAGELVYIKAGGRLESTSIHFAADQPYIDLRLESFDTAVISPNGLFVAGKHIDADGTTDSVAVFDQSLNAIYVGAISQSSILDLQWLGNDHLLSFVSIPTGSPFGSEADVAYYEIDVINRAYTFVRPPYMEPFYNESPRFPLFSFFRFSYDGRYLWVGSTAFDFALDQFAEFENIRVGVPALRSHRVLSVDHETYRAEGAYPVYVYDFETDAAMQVASFSPDSEINEYPNTWSPDETLWAYTLYVSEDDAGSFPHLELLELASGEIVSTCLGGGSDYAWSRDSRYLAVRGVPEGHGMEESFGVYIYDTQTEEIYEVYRGRADVIGWMAS